MASKNPKPKPKSETSNALSSNFDELNNSGEKKTRLTPFSRGVLISAPISFILGVLIFSFTPLAAPVFPWNSVNVINLEGRTTGEVALTQQELTDILKEEDLAAYWLGPQAGAKYTLNVTAGNQVFIRYLPNGEGLEDISQSYIVVATYQQEDAYTITEAAGTQADSVSFMNAEGGMVYYSKLLPTNVYVAYDGEPFSIEIFDPIDGGALSSAATVGKLVRIN
jgi:hypothetical protein